MTICDPKNIVAAVSLGHRGDSVSSCRYPYRRMPPRLSKIEPEDKTRKVLYARVVIYLEMGYGRPGC